MSTLPDILKKQLVKREPNLSVNKLVEYIQTYDNLSTSDFPAMDPQKKELIDQTLNHIPNPEEQAQWNELSSKLLKHDQSTLDLLNQYIKKWSVSNPHGNHVEYAKQLVADIKREIEEEKWNNLDITNVDALKNYLVEFPDSVHKVDIDEIYWSLLDKESVSKIQDYIKTFPSGLHHQEAEKILSDSLDWSEAKASNDIFIIARFIQNHPDSSFLKAARIILLALKETEISAMKSNPTGYDMQRFNKLQEEHIFSDSDLIQRKVVTPNILRILRETELMSQLPDINRAIEESEPECKNGYTDVFFFGVPSTGKTCVLMGLSSSNSININLAAGGGEYAAALQEYTDLGVTATRTPGTFVTTLEGKITSYDKNSTSHLVNLVEMSGEEFAFQIAKNPDHICSFEDMGTGATDLLKNENRKLFFLIVDPTVTTLNFARKITTFDENTGQKIVGIQKCQVNQRTLLQKIVNLFEHEDNSEIMKKVDSIHIIMTKSDLLGSPFQRDEKAVKLFNERYSGSILTPLKELCQLYNINSNTKFLPKLYTFSLGNFYLGGYYEYDSTDADKLIKAIQNSTHAIRKATFWDKLKKVVNNSR